MNKQFSEKALRDIKIVKEACKGNQKAFSELMELYKLPIYYMILKMVNNTDDADDITIEALGKAFKNIDNYTPDYAFSTWLFRIASNHCIDFIRKKKMEKSISINNSAEYISPSNNGAYVTLQSDNPDPEEEYIFQQNKKHLYDIIKNLSPRYREVITLRIDEGLSYVEIATQLNMPIGTVKVRLVRAKALISSSFKKTH